MRSGDGFDDFWLIIILDFGWKAVRVLERRKLVCERDDVLGTADFLEFRLEAPWERVCFLFHLLLVLGRPPTGVLSLTDVLVLCALRDVRELICYNNNVIYQKGAESAKLPSSSTGLLRLL